MHLLKNSSILVETLNEKQTELLLEAILIGSCPIHLERNTSLNMKTSYGSSKSNEDRSLLTADICSQSNLSLLNTDDNTHLFLISGTFQLHIWPFVVQPFHCTSNGHPSLICAEVIIFEKYPSYKSTSSGDVPAKLDYKKVHLGGLFTAHVISCHPI
jgi:hypothetical protein